MKYRIKILNQMINYLKYIFLSTIFLTTFSLEANYRLVIGTYRQGPSGRPEVSGITSPSLYSIPMKDLETCKKAGKTITDEIYKPVWQFDSKWICIYSGS